MKRYLLIICIHFLSAAAYSQSISRWKITDLENYVSNSKSDVLIINMWATFCKPCVAELPGFIKVAERYKNDKVSLLLVSLDLPSYYPKKVESFAKKHRFTAPITWLDETNADYFCPKVDKAWSGSIPATLILNKKTGYRKFFEEEMNVATFEKEVRAAIKG
jgi:thiol-disulfide isomerase/thioredoxin